MKIDKPTADFILKIIRDQINDYADQRDYCKKAESKELDEYNKEECRSRASGCNYSVTLLELLDENIRRECDKQCEDLSQTLFRKVVKSHVKLTNSESTVWWIIRYGQIKHGLYDDKLKIFEVSYDAVYKKASEKIDWLTERTFEEIIDSLLKEGVVYSVIKSPFYSRILYFK